MSVSIYTIITDLFPIFKHIEVTYESSLRVIWVKLKPERFVITIDLLKELLEFQKCVNLLTKRDIKQNDLPLFVCYKSDHPEYFLLGGDLELIIDCVGTNDRHRLRDYALRCLDVCINNLWLLGGNIYTIVAMSGIAAGGGFEAVAACAHIISDKRSRFVLPELQFSLFPALAYGLVGKKTGSQFVNRMIFSRKAIVAQEAYEERIVDTLAEADVYDEARRFMQRFQSAQPSLCAMHRATLCEPSLSKEAMCRTIEDWIDCVFSVSETDLVKMRRIVRRNQDAGIQKYAIDEQRKAHP